MLGELSKTVKALSHFMEQRQRQNGGNCSGCGLVDTGNRFVYDQYPYLNNQITDFFNQLPQHQRESYYHQSSPQRSDEIISDKIIAQENLYLILEQRVMDQQVSIDNIQLATNHLMELTLKLSNQNPMITNHPQETTVKIPNQNILFDFFYPEESDDS
ncbi:hypothetical protein Tco_0884455 [Tanacetum coccineum]